MTVHLLAAVAEQEREMISQRTKAGLAATKVRCTRLGNPRLPPFLRSRTSDTGCFRCGQISSGNHPHCMVRIDIGRQHGIPL